MTLPLISIVIPSYNQGQYIEETLKSIFVQDYKNYEIIVIDGNSEDQTKDIINKYKDKIYYYCSEPDNGQTEALIKGFNISRGEIFYWLCSDDQLLPGVLRLISEIFRKNKDLDFVYGDTVYLYPDKTTNIKPRIRYHYKTMLWAFNIIAQPSCFFSKNIFLKSGGLDPKLNYSMDYDLFLRFGPKPKFIQIKKPLSLYRIHATSKTVNDVNKFLKEWSYTRTKITKIPYGITHKILWFLYTLRVVIAYFFERRIIKILPDNKKYRFTKSQ